MTGAGTRRLIPGVEPSVRGPAPAPLLAPGYGAQGGTPADIRRIFGAASGAVLASSSRELLALGPDPDALRDGVRRANDDLAGLAG